MSVLLKAVWFIFNIMLFVIYTILPNFLLQSVLKYAITSKRQLSMSSLDSITGRVQGTCTASACNVLCSVHKGDFGLQAINLAPSTNVKFTAKKV